MPQINWEGLSGIRPGCLSDLTLDRFHHEELAADERSAAAAHVETCKDCRKRLDLRKEGFSAFPTVDEAALAERIRRSVEGEPGSLAAAGSNGVPKSGVDAPRAGFFSWIFRHRFELVAVAATAVVAVVAGVHLTDRVRSGDGNGAEGFRAKGGPELRVFRLRAGEVREARSGDRLAGGDALRFVLSLPEAGHVMIVGKEASTRLYVVQPADGTDASRFVEAGARRELPGAVRLDQSRGDERLCLVVCPAAFAIRDLRTDGPGGALSVPAGCTTRYFDFVKE